MAVTRAAPRAVHLRPRLTTCFVPMRTGWRPAPMLAGEDQPDADRSAGALGGGILGRIRRQRPEDPAQGAAARPTGAPDRPTGAPDRPPPAIVVVHKRPGPPAATPTAKGRKAPRLGADPLADDGPPAGLRGAVDRLLEGLVDRRDKDGS